MKTVVMNETIFTNGIPFQYIVPTLVWSTGKSDWHISDIQVTVGLNYSTGKYRITIRDTFNNWELMNSELPTACAATGKQKNIDMVMGLVKSAVSNDRIAQIQLAANLFVGWLKAETGRWLASEAARDFGEVPCSIDYCNGLVYGIETVNN